MCVCIIMQYNNTNLISIAHLKQQPLTKVLSSLITYSHTNMQGLSALISHAPETPSLRENIFLKIFHPDISCISSDRPVAEAGVKRENQQL